MTSRQWWWESRAGPADSKAPSLSCISYSLSAHIAGGEVVDKDMVKHFLTGSSYGPRWPGKTCCLVGRGSQGKPVWQKHAGKADPCSSNDCWNWRGMWDSRGSWGQSSPIFSLAAMQWNRIFSKEEIKKNVITQVSPYYLSQCLNSLSSCEAPIPSQMFSKAVCMPACLVLCLQPQNWLEHLNSPVWRSDPKRLVCVCINICMHTMGWSSQLGGGSSVGFWQRYFWGFLPPIYGSKDRGHRLCGAHWGRFHCWNDENSHCI